MEDIDQSEIENLMEEYQKKRAALRNHLDFMKAALKRELDKKVIPCLERRDLVRSMKTIYIGAELCRKMYVELKNAGYTPPGKPLEEEYLNYVQPKMERSNQSSDSETSF